MATPALGGRTLPNGEDGVFKNFILATSASYLVGIHNTSADTANLWIDFSFTEEHTT
jgi:hypothetical protein